MKRAELIETYWEEFLRNCHYELVTLESNQLYERTMAKPTMDNFWAWYMKNKLTQDHNRIDDFLDKQKTSSDK